ncbi:Dehydrogenase/reductase SDR family protein 7-like [Gryllus bimaculatus]|nr:Dehydrogenase/reductase SDR family protein 7-like [Gryllus bimaculatus]
MDFCDFLAIIGVLTTLYFIVYITALCITDCDLELAWAEKFGRPIDVLEGDVAWITGASSGIGEHIALALAQAGVRLVLSARRKAELDRVKQKCIEIGRNLKDEDILVLPLDVTDYDCHQECFDRVIDHFGTLDILINNAGRSQRADWEKIELSVDKQMFDLNVFGVVALSRIAVRYFLEKGGGHIAVTSSLAGVFGVPFSGTYDGTKHAIHGYFNGLLAEKIGKNIHVTLLCPGPTFSNFLAESFTDTAGEKYGQPVRPTDRRMTGERCGKLCAVAIANRQREAWMGLFPLMPLVYLIYFPNLGSIILPYIGSKQLMKLRDSKVK